VPPAPPSSADRGITADVDNDGMADSWEKWYLGTLDRDGRGDSDGDSFTDAEERAMNMNPSLADSDGDGLDDFQESVAGTDPMLSSNCLRVVATEVGNDGNAGITIRWDTVVGRTYTIHGAQSMPGKWSVVHQVDGDGRTGSYTSSSTRGNKYRYFRVGVRLKD